MRIVIAGNPGAGKSTLLNTLTGDVIFPSGISIGSGLTKTSATHSVSGLQFVDTPGLADVDTRHQAAAELSNALSDTTELKLVFVCTLESGTVRSGDLATIDAVLRALEDAGASVWSRFSVIVNKCTETELCQLADETNKERIRSIFSRKRGVPRVLFLPLVRQAMGAPNFLLDSRDICWDFLNFAPVIVLPPETVVTIKVEDYDAEQNQLEGELLSLRRRYSEELKRKQALERTKRIIKYVARGLGLVVVCGLLRRFAKFLYFSPPPLPKTLIEYPTE